MFGFDKGRGPLGTQEIGWLRYLAIGGALVLGVLLVAAVVAD